MTSACKVIDFTSFKRTSKNGVRASHIVIPLEMDYYSSRPKQFAKYLEVFQGIQDVRELKGMMQYIIDRNAKGHVSSDSVEPLLYSCLRDMHTYAFARGYEHHQRLLERKAKKEVER